MPFWILGVRGASRGHELVCVYDWDSLRIGSEPCIVGGAARCFAHDWRSEGPERSITLAEALAFVHEYEAARGKPLRMEKLGSRDRSHSSLWGPLCPSGRSTRNRALSAHKATARGLRKLFFERKLLIKFARHN
jgi:hypothetical protein